MNTVLVANVDVDEDEDEEQHMEGGRTERR